MCVLILCGRSVRGHYQRGHITLVTPGCRPSLPAPLGSKGPAGQLQQQQQHSPLLHRLSGGLRPLQQLRPQQNPLQQDSHDASIKLSKWAASEDEGVSTQSVDLMSACLKLNPNAPQDMMGIPPLSHLRLAPAATAAPPPRMPRRIWHAAVPRGGPAGSPRTLDAEPGRRARGSRGSERQGPESSRSGSGIPAPGRSWCVYQEGAILAREEEWSPLAGAQAHDGR